jgi:hypothetical protein
LPGETFSEGRIARPPRAAQLLFSEVDQLVDAPARQYLTFVGPGIG